MDSGVNEAQQDLHVGTSSGLKLALLAIDSAGWSSDQGAQVLHYARVQVVRPVIRRTGLYGPVAAQAEATGWETSWELLSGKRIRSADHPWGLVTAAVRRAVLGELISTAFGITAREAWRVTAELRTADLKGTHPAIARPPVSLCALRARGWEPAASSELYPLGPLVEVVISAMVGQGWPPAVALALVHSIADNSRPRARSTATLPGWRRIGHSLGLPAWQVRRVSILLLGSPGWAGVLERIVVDGVAVLQDPDVVLALRSTRCRWLPSPASIQLNITGLPPQSTDRGSLLAS